MTTKTRIGGRAKGTKNRTTAQTKQIIQALIASEIDGLPELLQKLKPIERATVLIKLLAYIIPKQSSIDLTAEITDRFTPVIVQITDPKQLEQ
ncbi:hypothetical protein [Flavobacterium sp.]|uniref:hypothetical protein n=1 Tax=Flavobacterium sp. TaxID=239 RepID=UPI002C2D432C|nr:hypothetical protein [Flavobacterium sp.]HSD06967.1 hypothetical protein [Flavobacterium sp.]